MKKLAIALLILVTTLMAEDKTVGDIYTNRLTSFRTNLSLNGSTNVSILCFDFDNSQILQARLRKFDSLFRPWTNSHYDYMFNLLCTNQVTILDLEDQLRTEQLKKKWWVRGTFISVGCYVIGKMILKSVEH
jgi:hypothetical protein